MPLSCAAWVRQVREASGLSQELFGERIGASRVQGARWETNVNEPSGGHVLAIISAFPAAATLLTTENRTEIDLAISDLRLSVPTCRTMEARELAAVVDELPLSKRVYIRDLAYRVLGHGTAKPDTT